MNIHVNLKETSASDRGGHFKCKALPWVFNPTLRPWRTRLRVLWFSIRPLWFRVLWVYANVSYRVMEKRWPSPHTSRSIVKDPQWRTEMSPRSSHWMSLILREWTAWERKENEKKVHSQWTSERKWDKDRDTKPHRQTKADTEVEVGFLWPLLEAHLGWGVLLWQDASVPSVSLFKSPKQGADVSHGPALPLFSLGTPLNRWGSQQVQESAQTPLFFLPASLYVYSTTRLPFPCPSVLHALLCCLKLSSLIPLQITPHRHPLTEAGEGSKSVWTLKWYLKVPLKNK